MKALVLMTFFGCGLVAETCISSRADAFDEPAGSTRQSASQKTGRKPGPKGPAAEERKRVLRAYDPPPKHDEAQLAALGIRRYASKRLQLFTDLEAEKARLLPPLMNQIYDAWVEYFGPLPPDAHDSEFVMTGYLMVDQRPFRESGLLPDNLPQFPHGRNKGTRFWLNDQPTDYYRRHLLLHEGTHCYMTAVQHPYLSTVWYMEGMAELFATHRIDDNGQARFRVLPHDREQFANLGRIRLIEDEVQKSGPRSLRSVMDLGHNDFLKNPAYAWSWCACQYFDGTPRTRDVFRRLGRAVVTGVADESAEEQISHGARDVEEGWLLFAANLCHGYDQERATVDFQPGVALLPDDPVTLTIAADRGWQPTRVLVRKGQPVTISATGRIVIARGSGPDAVPWECEPQGVSIRYHAGEPLGKLVAVIRSSDPPQGAQSSLLEVIPIGRERRITPRTSGTLYLRLNDAWNELAGNAGQIEVQIRRDP
jgi:hypothetical protein